MKKLDSKYKHEAQASESTTRTHLLALRACIALTIILLVALQVKADEPVDFNTQIRPLLSNRCFACHGPDEEERAADLRLDTEEGALDWAIVSGEPDDSEVYSRIISEDEDSMMPPPGKGDPFTEEEAELIARWIREGANYSRHWSYVKPVRPDVPGGRNPIDHFIGQRLAKEGLGFSPEADRRTLARRVALDLTGLPPTPEEVEAFVSNRDPKAYEQFVDELLARSSFGEHWARMWLDLARYADSAGYADDIPRTIWSYRDYVIRSFNENKPFDQFTIEQLAGDLLENPSDDQLIATAFHRNTQTNNEGGTNDEEFRNVAVVDRVNTTFATWMGTTMACAQCHTHKYDPITQEEYYRVFAILNQTLDADKRDESPILSMFTEQQEKQKADLRTQIAELEKKLQPSDDPALLAALSEWEKNLGEVNWHVLQPTDLAATSGADLTVENDDSIFASGAKAEVDEYSFKAKSSVEKITALRVELLTDDRLPDSGPARGHNLVLNELTLQSGSKGDAQTRRGRFVRLELPGKNQFLHVAEVQCFVGDTNVAIKGTATQSTTGFGGLASVAIDGDYMSKSFSHTAKDDPSPWWEVDLGSEKDLSRIVVWNRTDNGLQHRLDGFRLVVLDEQRREVFEKIFPKAPMRDSETRFDGVQVAKFAHATASYEQPNFEAPKAIDGNASKNSGWAIAGGAGRNHQAVFQLKYPLSARDVSLKLRQTYPNHPIGRFRISVTDSAEPAVVLPEDIANIVATPPANRDSTDQQRLLKYFAKLGPQGKQTVSKIAELRQKLNAIKPEATVPILREVAQAKRRKTHIHIRGSYLNHGDEVQAGFPVSLTPAPEGDALPDRLALAHWLLGEDNPLTARVVANRYWEKIHGVGIVATSEEFGSQGELPFHPELLDWLALELKESGWDTKAFLKLLVTSRAYRQSSNVTKELEARDPANRLLGRGPRVRLSAEMVRDQALAVSGLLSPKMFGPPVRPPQPDMGLKAAFGAGIDWKTSEGEDRFRRGIYTTWRRSNPYPSMTTFDAPNREVCTVRRDRTNTPLQALVTLNDPVFIEAAQSLARRMASASEAIDDKIRIGFKRCLSRSPSKAELARLVQFYEQARERYASDKELAEKMATDPIGPAPEGSDIVDLAALTLTANVLLNLDEMLMKR